MNCMLNFTKTAKENLCDITLYIVKQSGDKSIGTCFVKEIEEKCNVLIDFPESGSLPKDRVLLSSGYRFLVYKEYLIFYLYKKLENMIYIMAVFNAKRDYMKVMKEFI